jgi:hypothetical protein
VPREAFEAISATASNSEGVVLRMSRLILAVCFVCTALGVAAPAASAEPPEYRACVNAQPANTGSYSEATCSKASEVSKGGKYERAAWNKGKVSFTAKNKGPLFSSIMQPVACVRREPETGRCQEWGNAATPAENWGEIACKSGSITGELTGPKTATLKAKFGSCSPGKPTKCTTEGQKAGTIVTDQLESTLVNLDKGPGHKRVGIRIKGLGPAGRVMGYVCGFTGQEDFGELLAEVKGNLNSAAKTSEISLQEGPLNLQSNLYEEEAFSEEAAKAYFEAKGPPADKPIWLEASGLIVVLHGVTSEKGESMLLEDN